MPNPDKYKHENLNAAEVESAKKINEQLHEMGMKKYPEEFLSYLKETEPTKFDEFMLMEQELAYQTPADILDTLDSALKEWETRSSETAENPGTSDATEEAKEAEEVTEEYPGQKDYEYFEKRLLDLKMTNTEWMNMLKEVAEKGLASRQRLEWYDRGNDKESAQKFINAGYNSPKKLLTGLQFRLNKPKKDVVSGGPMGPNAEVTETVNQIFEDFDFALLAATQYAGKEEKIDEEVYKSNKKLASFIESKKLGEKDWKYMLEDAGASGYGNNVIGVGPTGLKKGLRSTFDEPDNFTLGAKMLLNRYPTPESYIDGLRNGDSIQKFSSYDMVRLILNYFPKGASVGRHIEDATTISESEEPVSEGYTAKELKELTGKIRDDIENLPPELRGDFRKRTNAAIEAYNDAETPEDKEKAADELYQIARDIESELTSKDDETPAPDEERSSSSSDVSSSSSGSVESGGEEAGERSDDETEHSAPTDAGTVPAPAGDSGRSSVDAGTPQAPEGEKVQEAHESHEKALATLNQLARFGFNVKPGSRRNFTERIEMNIKKKYKREYGDHVQVSLKDIKVENGEARVVLTIRGEQNEPTAKFEEMILKGFANAKFDKTSSGRVDVGNGMQVEDSKANRDAVKKLFKKSMFNNIFELKVLDQTDVAKADTEAGVEHGSEVARLAEYVQETYLDADVENKRAFKRAAKYAGFKNKRDAEKSLKANWEKLKASGLLTDDEASKVDSLRKK